METIEIELPAPLAEFVKEFPVDSVTAFKRAAFLLYAYIDSEMLSTGKAAELLGMRKFDLIDFYGVYGIPYVRVDEDVYHLVNRKKLTKMGIFSPPPSVLSFDEIRRRVVPLCEPNGISYLLLFGDYAKKEVPMDAENQLETHIHFYVRFYEKTAKQYDEAKFAFENILGRYVDLMAYIPEKAEGDTFYDKLHQEIEEGIVLYDCHEY